MVEIRFMLLNRFHFSDMADIHHDLHFASFKSNIDSHDLRIDRVSFDDRLGWITIWDNVSFY